MKERGGELRSTYATTCSGTWTGMPYGIVALFLGLWGPAILEILAI